MLFESLLIESLLGFYSPYVFPHSFIIFELILVSNGNNGRDIFFLMNVGIISLIRKWVQRNNILSGFKFL